MKHTFTAGPWFYHRAPAVGGGSVHIIQASPSRGVTVTTIQSGKSSDRIEEVCEANARLIAAAPDMLAALKAVADIKGWSVGGYSHPPISATGIQVMTAIAKAEGRS